MAGCPQTSKRQSFTKLGFRQSREPSHLAQALEAWSKMLGSQLSSGLANGSGEGVKVVLASSQVIPLSKRENSVSEQDVSEESSKWPRQRFPLGLLFSKYSGPARIV